MEEVERVYVDQDEIGDDDIHIANRDYINYYNIMS